VKTRTIADFPAFFSYFLPLQISSNKCIIPPWIRLQYF
jgi:hypothetical protein